jgi:hypothetical protein
VACNEQQENIQALKTAALLSRKEKKKKELWEETQGRPSICGMHSSR